MSAQPDLGSLTCDWFLFLSTCRRQTAALPGDPVWMRDKLDGMMAEMEADSRSDPHLQMAFQDAKFPLVYLADEILLSIGWEGERAWAADLYETRTFGTQHAGLDFFTRLDKAMSSDRVDLILVYFRCACLGFKGKLIKQPEALHNIRRDLYRRLPSAKIEGQRFCPEAYEQTDLRSFVKLPVVNAARIIIPLVGLLIGAWVMGMLVTQSEFSEIDDVAEAYVNPQDD
jgi:type IV/VI secretion system ImpK/VasF family protein